MLVSDEERNLAEQSRARGQGAAFYERKSTCLPTLAGIAGVKPVAAIPGVDPAPLLKGQAIKQRRRSIGHSVSRAPPSSRAAPSPSAIGAPRLAVREGKWKLLAEADGSNVQLYDLDRDPNESRDLGGEQPRLRDRLKQLFAWAAKLPRP